MTHNGDSGIPRRVLGIMDRTEQRLFNRRKGARVADIWREKIE